MPRRGENIYKRKDGRWEGRYIKCRINGTARYGYVYARSYKEVKDKLLSAAETAHMEQGQTRDIQTRGAEICFADAAAEWLAARKPQLKESSIVKYMNILEGNLLPAFAQSEVFQISREDIRGFSNRLLVSGGVKGKGLSPKTVADILSVLKNILKYSAREGGYPETDFEDLFIKQPQKPMRILSHAEQKRLNRYLYENLSLCNLGILLCLYTGLRVGEICALKWEDIVFEERYLHVHQTMQRIQKKNDDKKKTKILIAPPKSDCSIRNVPIPDEVFRLVSESKCASDAYFLTGTVHSYMEPRTMQNRFKAAVKACGIGDANFHALRHTFATRCVELGFDVKSLSEILGHASVNITLNRYVHPSMELKQRNMNMFCNLFSVK